MELTTCIEHLMMTSDIPEQADNKGLVEAHTRVMKYVKGKSEKVGVRECLHKLASSKSFWDSHLSLLRRRRYALWKMAKYKGWSRLK